MAQLRSNTALVVLSGGQDSTTCLAWAKKNYAHVHAVTFDYGQRHAIEIEAARTVARMLGADSHEIVTLPDTILASTSPLVKGGEDLERYESPEQMDAIIGDRVEKTFVPMRNALFAVIAANRAVALGAATIVLGVCEADNANYPDCRAIFVVAMREAINEALGGDRIRIAAPLISMTKAQSIELATTLPGAMEALAYSHTCYDGQVPPCGTCHACVLRADGFAKAGVDDPLVVRTRGADAVVA
jgi:7-cyano-7-deazaguanine synthase